MTAALMMVIISVAMIGSLSMGISNESFGWVVGICRLLRLLILLDYAKQRLKHLSEVWLRREIVPLEATIALGLVLFPICFVFGFLELQISHFFNLIVADDDCVTIEYLIVQLLLCFSSISRFLEAYESETVAISRAVVVLDIFNLAITFEDFKYFFFGH